MKIAEFDQDGDITDNTFETIVKWDKNWREFYDFIEDCYDTNYGMIKKQDGKIAFVTGGWSINERILQAMTKNFMFMGLFWISSHRGGKYVFENLRYEDNKNQWKSL